LIHGMKLKLKCPRSFRLHAASAQKTVHSFVVGGVNNRIESGVKPFDLVDGRLDQLNGRHLPPANEVGKAQAIIVRVVR
jgi:hypothetical protein